jgi:DNA-binding NtrC family response regulator
VVSERSKRAATPRRSSARESRETEPSRQRTELASDDPALQGLWETSPVVEPGRRGGFTQSLLGVSPAMRRVFRLVAKIAPTESPVLITGESGTGKELIARAIHLQSRRAHRSFVSVNASAVPESLFESELFGHVRGSFTGAVADRPGLFLQADGGTLFLDEIGEMPPAAQVKLLRALQDGEIRRVGSSDPVRVDVRVVAATNRDLKEALASGQFREDLYFRLNVFHIELLPLRERPEDIPVLANYFREKYGRAAGRRVDRFSERAQFYLMRYAYPGNVRELENAVERAVALAEHGEITHLDLPPSFREASVPMLPSGTAFPYSETMSLAQLEAEHIRRALRYFAGNTTRTARSLGVSRSTLWRKMREYGL